MSAPGHDNFCISSNPDIYGIGVRTAIYAQNLLSFGPAIFALLDKKVSLPELETLETQSTTILITAFAILVSTIAQAAPGTTEGITNFHVAIILNLSWMNNTNLFVYFLLYVYRRGEQRHASNKKHIQGLDVEGHDNPDHARSNWRKELRKAARIPVFIIGSIHLSLMAAVGIWLWSKPASFPNSPSCSLSTSVSILGMAVKLGSSGLRIWSILIYSLLLIPVVNLIIPVAFFSAPYLLYTHVYSSPSDRAKLRFTIFGLTTLALIDLALLFDTERALNLKANKLLLQDNSNWTFGQILALLLLLVPIRDLVETFLERRPKALGKRLVKAAREGRTDAVKSLLELGADTRSKDKRGRTALYLAAYQGYTEIVQSVIEHGATIEATGSDGKTALHLTADKGYTEIVRYLVDHGANVAAQDVHQNTPLYLSAMAGHTEIVKCLIEHGASLDARYNHWRTPLHLAAEKGHTDTCRCLIELGADVNAQDSFRKTALHLAAVQGHTNTVNSLIEHGADVDARDKWRNTALLMATHKRNIAMIRCLLEHGAMVHARSENPTKPTALHMAADNGDVEAVKYLIEHNADMSATDETNRTALHCAAQNGHIEVAKYLLEHGANVAAKDVSDNTAVQLSLQQGCVDMGDQLLEYGAEINARDSSGSTALHQATEEGRLDVVKWLLAKGASINEKDNMGRTALHRAIEEQQEKIIGYLIQHGADVHLQNNAGHTPADIMPPDRLYRSMPLSESSKPDIWEAANSG